MGLFSALLTLPLAPVRGAAWVAGQVAEEADRQLYDEGRIRAELLQLEFASEEGLLSEEEEAAQEEDLLQRLAVSQARRAAAQRPPANDLEDELYG
jgi:hypothetical protein